MDQERGRFEKGAWVEEGEGEKGEDARKRSGPFDRRFEEVSHLVSSSLSEIFSLARDLVTTPEGQAHIRQSIDQASTEIERSLAAVADQVREKLKEKGVPDEKARSGER
ncbi:MAG: hypothetical protein NQU46_00775 [Methanolinea sp.]|nr:hypothetical protein [Methanolinea sp.]